MNTSRFLISTTAALAVVGVIGLAYAQSTDNNATGTINPGQTNAEPAAAPPTLPTSPATQAAPGANAAQQDMPAGGMPETQAAPQAPTDTAPAEPQNRMDGMTRDLPARADRN